MVRMFSNIRVSEFHSTTLIRNSAGNVCQIQEDHGGTTRLGMTQIILKTFSTHFLIFYTVHAYHFIAL